MPDTLSDVDAAPLLCAGITTYNALRHSGALPGDLVAMLGLGGLGHLGIQFANKFGYRVAAIGLGSEDARAKQLGASVYIDSKSTNAAQALQKTWRRTGSSGDRPKLKSHVCSDRRSGAQRQAHGDWCGI
jgi:D-arabinose 1-dehydrogenase-like Zn-dependent alcohol dehydrogenase